MPTEFDTGAQNNKPKRSKSMAARFRAGRRNPNNPMMADDDDDDDTSRKQLPPAPAPEVGVLRYGDPDQSQQANGAVRFDGNGSRRSPPRKDSIGRPVEQQLQGPPSSRFAGSSALGNTRSLGQEGQPESPQLGRRPSVMQRLFNKKSSTRVRLSLPATFVSAG